MFIWNLLLGYWNLTLYAQQNLAEPVIVNGDTVEYSTDNKEVTASGNVSIKYKGTTLTCSKITVNTATKDSLAEGNVRIEDKQGLIEGQKIIYNFQTKAGIIMDANFRANPYFGRSERVDRASEDEFIAHRGYMSTCNLDIPHYRIKSRKMNFFPGDKVQTKDDTLYVGHLPLFYLPQYNHSLKDPLMHVQLSPGKKKEWGPYMLTASRYNLTENMSGRIYADYRSKLGMAEGFGLNYKTQKFGRGDYKYYYTQERSRFFEQDQAAEFQRYFIRWRHKWDPDEYTNIISQYYKIVDSKRAVAGTNYNFLKDYFFREYEKDSQPLSYVSFHRNFHYSTLDAVIQKRTNRWYEQLEKLPEVKYSLSGIQLGESPFYFQNNTQAANFNYKYAVPPATSDIHQNRFDMSNKVSLPTRVAFIRLNPFVMDRFTYYGKDIDGNNISPRTIFYAGSDVSTKFYRVFNIKTNFLGLDLDGLRHIITPTIAYTYNHEPTTPMSKIEQIDSLDSIVRNNSATLELSSKLQTKRNNQSIDFMDFRINSTYSFKPKAGRGSNLSDILFNLELLPYAWLRVDADATYKRSGNRDDVNYSSLSNLNYDIIFDFTKERTFSFGQRYQRKGGNEITYKLDWRLNPKWAFSVYQRRERGHDLNLQRGLREQEYAITRDLHCWEVDLAYNIKRGQGESVWMIFRLKAFPELEFEFNQDYHKPKSGSQSYTYRN